MTRRSVAGIAACMHACRRSGSGLTCGACSAIPFSSANRTDGDSICSIRAAVWELPYVPNGSSSTVSYCRAGSTIAVQQGQTDHGICILLQIYYSESTLSCGTGPCSRGANSHEGT